MGRTSADEKKRMLLKVYHTAKAPFNMKELTKAGAAAGLNAKLIEGVNAQLMDDNYVQSDKIGPGNYFWSFPGAQGAAAQKQLDAAKANLERAKARLAAAKEAEAAAKVGREDPDGTRAAKLKKIAELQARRQGIEAQLEGLKENDPEELARVEALADEMKGHAQRWAENLFSLKAWLVQKKGVDASQVDDLFKSVGLPKNLDLD